MAPLVTPEKRLTVHVDEVAHFNFGDEHYILKVDGDSVTIQADRQRDGESINLPLRVFESMHSWLHRPASTVFDPAEPAPEPNYRTGQSVPDYRRY